MGWQIHYRIQDDEPVFRIWSTVVDAYIAEGTEDEIKAFWIEGELSRALDNATRHLETAIPRAKEFGDNTYDPRFGPPPIDGDWETERSEWEDGF